MRIVIIDNYDSFTYNLAHLVKSLGADVTVLRNDRFALEELEAFDKIILSPGPGIPSEAGLLMDVIRTYAGRKPMLGVCLGHRPSARSSAPGWRTCATSSTAWLPKAGSPARTPSSGACPSGS